MTLGGELLAYGITREVAQLDQSACWNSFSLHGPSHAEGKSEGLKMVRQLAPLPVLRAGQIPAQEIPQRWRVARRTALRCLIGQPVRRGPQVFEDMRDWT